MLKRHLAPLLLALVATGCASYDAYQTVPMPDQAVDLENRAHARMYVIREDQTIWSRAPLLVYNGADLIGSLEPGSYLCWERGPGRVLGRLILDRPELDAAIEKLWDVQLEGGEVRWVMVRFDNSGQTIVAERLSPEGGAAAVAASRAVDVR